MVGALVRRALGVPVVTALSADNPGPRPSIRCDRGRRGRHRRLVASGHRANGTPRALKLLRSEPLGPADVEGYLPTGRRVNQFGEATGAERMVEMLLRRLRHEPFTSEVVVPRFDGATPAPPVRDLREIVLGIVTTSGVVRAGEPRGRRGLAGPTVRYSLAGLDRMSADEYTCVHGGYDNRHVRADPNRTVPLDVLREWEKQGRIGRLHNMLWSTVGNVMPVEWARQRGREVAQELREAGSRRLSRRLPEGPAIVAGQRSPRRSSAQASRSRSARPSRAFPSRWASPGCCPGSRSRPAGQSLLPPLDERELRERLTARALDMLTAEVAKPTLFPAA